MPLNFNPFKEFGVTDHKQYKKYPFLQSISINNLKLKIDGSIRDNFMCPERLLILGEPGIGKSTALFYVEDLLNEAKKCNVFLLTNLFTDADDFKKETGEDLYEMIKDKTYFLVDFPDTIHSSNFKRFLDFLWTLIHHKNYDNINFVFALNISHFNRSLNLSEILNKFERFRLERWNKEESECLVKSRLQMAGSNNYFNAEVYEVIFRYSKGIPRNIICASKALVEKFFTSETISKEQADSILKEEYLDKIIDDRTEDLGKRLLYRQVIGIVKNKYNCEVQMQKDLIEVMIKQLSIGRNKAMATLSELHKFGILTFTKGGLNNTNKIISLK